MANDGPGAKFGREYLEEGLLLLDSMCHAMPVLEHRKLLLEPGTVTGGSADYPAITRLPRPEAWPARGARAWSSVLAWADDECPGGVCVSKWW